jgi:diguanylate cyclase (GGDEF)-like protein
MALAAAGAAVAIFAFVAAVAVRARNRSDLRTQDALRRISDSVHALSHSLETTRESLWVEDSRSAFPVTLDLDEALRRAAAVAAALPGMTAGAARVDRLDGTSAIQTIGISSGSTGLEIVPDSPDRAPWRLALVEWVREPSPLQEPLQRAVIAPIVVNGERIGLIGAYASTTAVPTDVAEAVAALADSAGPAFGAAREHEAVKQLVRTDPLTGMLNRRGLDEELAREIARAVRLGAPLSVLMLDLDDFKRVNATNFVHGDDVLRELARIIREASRETDIPCRRGGEEFTIILPDTPCAAALRVDARIRALVQVTDFPHAGRITYSAGITSLREGDDADLLDRRASALVNDVKRAGKNDVRHDCGPAELSE